MQLARVLSLTAAPTYGGGSGNKQQKVAIPRESGLKSGVKRVPKIRQRPSDKRVNDKTKPFEVPKTKKRPQDGPVHEKKKRTSIRRFVIRTIFN